jgi:hypothetical protein
VKAVLLLIGVLAIAAAGVAAFIAIDPFGDGSDPTSDREITGTACERLAGLAGQLAEEEDDATGFLFALGRNGAGIRAGSRGLGDLLRGGRNRIPGKGFLARYDDGSQGQVRHFSGIAVAVLYAKGDTTLWISRRLRNDRKGSADDELTKRGVDFAEEVVSGDLELEDAEDWILENLCRRKP